MDIDVDAAAHIGTVISLLKCQCLNIHSLCLYLMVFFKFGVSFLIECWFSVGQA